jgi:hypothetical protein
MKVTGRLRTALTAMVWAGACRADAAKIAGLTDHSLRAALKRPHVKAFYLHELDVLRTSERARNIHALVGVRDGAVNSMAKVAAVKALEQIDHVEAARGHVGEPLLPGLVIRIINTREAPRVVGPMIEHERARCNDDDEG